MMISNIDPEEIRDIYGKTNEIARLINISGTEVMAARFGLKPAMAEANTGVYDDLSSAKFDEVARICREMGMSFATSKYKYVINSPKGIFEEISLEDERDGSVIVGISTDIQMAISAVAHYHLKTKHTKYGRSFGELMGYPACCLDFGDYLANNNNNPENFGFKNPAIETLKQSKDIAWQLNVFSTESFLSHFPCNYTCERSLSYANDIIGLLSVANPSRADEIKKSLKEQASIYWTCVDKAVLYGDFERNDEYFRAGEMRYSQASWSIGSENFYQNNDPDFLNELNFIKKAMIEGNRISLTMNDLTIFHDNDELLRSVKKNAFLPVLVKATI